MDANFINMQMACHRLNIVNLPIQLDELPLEVLSIRYVEQAKERVSALHTPHRHRHTFIEVHAPVSEAQTYQFGGEFQTVKAGEVMIITPYTEHSIPYSHEDLRKYAINFSLSDSGARFKWINDAFEQKSWFHVTKAERVTQLFELIFKEAAEARQNWVYMVRSLAAILVCELARLIIPDAREEYAFHKPRESAQRIANMERFVRDNLAMPLTGAQLSAYMHLSIKQLGRDVKQERNMTLRELIDSIRLAEAKKLLVKPEQSVKLVGETLGFNDASSFNRFFKRLSGVSPMAFKRLSDEAPR